MKKKYLYIFLALVLFLIILYWIVPIDEMIFSIITFYLVLPISMFVTCLLAFDKIDQITIITIIIMTGLYMYTEYLTFSLSNMIAFHKFNSLDYSMLLSGLCVCFIGIIINKKFRMKKYNKK